MAKSSGGSGRGGLVAVARSQGLSVRTVPLGTRNFEKGYRYNIRGKDGTSMWARNLTGARRLISDRRRFLASRGR